MKGTVELNHNIFRNDQKLKIPLKKKLKKKQKPLKKTKKMKTKK